jgi:hypothetical protein
VVSSRQFLQPKYCTHFPLPTSYHSICPDLRSVVSFRNKLFSYGEEFIAPRPTPNLEDNPLSAYCYCFFFLNIECVSKSFRTESIMKYTLTTINSRWEATQRVMAAKLTRLTHRIAIQLHLVAESCTICSSRSRWPVRKLLDTPTYSQLPSISGGRLLHSEATRHAVVTGTNITWAESPWYSLDRRLGGPQSRSGRGGEEKNSQPPAGNRTLEPRPPSQ